MIDLVQAMTTGVTVAGAIKGLSALEGLFARRNGNSRSNGFSEGDRKTLEFGLDRLHDDLVEMRRDLRNCLDRQA